VHGESFSFAVSLAVAVVTDVICSWHGSFPVRKRIGMLRIWRAREREPIWGPGVQGQSPWSGGQSPPEAEGILLPKRANLSLSFK